MKKTFRFLALSLALICGTLGSSAAPIDGTYVGQKVSGGVVTYQVDFSLGAVLDVTAKYNGEDVKVKAYPVKIAGLDYDGIHTQNLTKLNIKTSFLQKDGPELNAYYVAEIIDTQGDDPTEALGIPYKKAFYGMTDLEELTFTADPDAVTNDKFTFSVGQYSFYGCWKLNTLEFEDNVNRIGAYAFQGTIITEFEIPAKCETIGACAFNDTKKLGKVTVSESGNDVLKKIDKQVFANSFVSILDLSNATALEEIDDQAFIFNVSDVNAQLKQVILPDVAPADNKFYSLGIYGTCFANCMALESVDNLEKSIVTDINPGAFENCVKLGELNFPATASIYTDGITSPFLNTPLLKKITFADGWAGAIRTGVYTSTNGNKIKYSTAEKKYVLEPYALTAADKKKELSYLEEIEFMGKVYGFIEFDAFGNNAADAACTGLTTVKFDGLICQGVTIDQRAFKNCSALATLTFNGFEIENGTSAPIIINNDAFMATAITAVDFKGFTFVGNATPTEIAIYSGAFAADQLASVTFGDIYYKEWKDGATWTAGAAHEFNLHDGAFVSDLLTTVTFGDIINDNTNEVSDGAGILNIGDGTGPVFAAKTATTGKLETVTFGKMVTGNDFTIDDYAFASELLKTVTFDDVTTVLDKNGKLAIGVQAFGWVTVEEANRKANEKTVTFGNIVETWTEPTKANVLTVTIDDAAFYGDLLKTVTIGEIGSDDFTIGNTGTEPTAPFGGNFAEKSVSIGNITSMNFTFNDYAFNGQLLKSVKIGDIKPVNAATTASFGAYSFGNTSQNDDQNIVQQETVTIGQLANAKLDFAANAFCGPQKDESTFDVTIKGAADEDGNEPGIEKAVKMAAGTFVGPVIGATTYTLGDINVNTTDIAAKAFGGSKMIDPNDPSKKINNTDVTIGNYNAKFQNVNTFTNVDDLVAKSWNYNQVITTFQNPKTMTIQKDVTAILNGGGLNSNRLESLTIGGNVKETAAITNFGEAVRKIAFTADDPEVYPAAIKSDAFTYASDDAMDEETISVIYRVKTATKSNAIFDVNAFGYDDLYKNVILYTDQWSLEHTFQNVEIGGSPDHVYRIKLNASSVAPGEDIEATCVKGANGKYSYGRLYVPAGTGMRYKVSAEYDATTKKNGVNLFSATISGTDIYMNTVTVMDGYYWIDATETAQTLIVRTSDVSADKVVVEAEAVSEAEAQAMDDEGSVILATDWFDAASAKKNALRYATSAITPAEFQNDATTYNKGIYVMANPAKNNLAFAKYNQTDSSTKDLAKGSIYVVTRANQYARLNVIWPEDIDEESDATAIQKIENDNEGNDAIYNLQGVRVKNAQKGLYIINGKKVIK